MRSECCARHRRVQLCLFLSWYPPWRHLKLCRDLWLQRVRIRGHLKVCRAWQKANAPYQKRDSTTQAIAPQRVGTASAQIGSELKTYVEGASRHATDLIANNSSGWRAWAHRVSFVVTEDAYKFWQCVSRTVFSHRENVVCLKRWPHLFFVL
jgi:hypothetical protein